VTAVTAGTAGLALPASLRSLAERLGGETAALPAYVYDLDGLTAHVADVRAALPPGVELYYAVKANPDAAVLRAVAAHADGLEVSSGGELRHVRAVVPGSPLALSGPGKTSGELADAVGAGAIVHVESPHELHQLAAVARDLGRVADVLLRVNLETGATGPAGEAEVLRMGGQPGPFGMEGLLLGGCARLCHTDPGLRLRGLHAHLASGLGADELLATAARVLDFGRRWCAAHGVVSPVFNVGGGMAVDYSRPGTLFDWHRYGQGLAALSRPGETLRVEPGRALTAYCGWYVARVLDVKRSYGETFAIVAGGTHHLRTPAAKGHDQPFAVIPVQDWAAPWPRPGAGGEPVTVTGQLCTPKDVLARRVHAGDLRAGDLLAFGMAGAYAWNISHHDFLMHPAPHFHYGVQRP
jgi:diaminopimelate decarboxylase